MISFARELRHVAAIAAIAGLLLYTRPDPLHAQATSPSSPDAELAQVPLPEPSANALPLPEDRGAADLEQTLKRLGTTASAVFIVPPPDADAFRNVTITQ